MNNSLFDPVIDGVQFYTYHRKPTKAEISFGYGATHYRDFHPKRVVKRSLGPIVFLKKYVVGDDGLRYYR